jgi:Apoptogenic protein 1
VEATTTAARRVQRRFLEGCTLTILCFFLFLRITRLTLKPSFRSVQTNTRFEAAKVTAIDSLSPHATAEQRNERLGEFYKSWVLQEMTRQQEYDSEWRRRSMEEIKLAARVSYQKFKARFVS